MSDDSVNPYVGCTHACRYCYASFMKRFTGHPEPWGTFLDVKRWPEIRRPERYAGKELFIGSVTDPYLLSAPGRDVRAHPRAAGAAQGQRGPHHLLCLAHLPRPHRWKGHHRPGEGAMQPDLAGKPQPAGQLQSGHPGLHSGKASAASAPVPGDLLQREPRLLGEAGCGAEGLCRRARAGLCDQRRQQEAAV